MDTNEMTTDARGGPRRFYSQPRVCQFCTDRSAKIDYKQTETLRRYVTESGKIRPRRQSGACAKHQREISPCHQARPSPGNVTFYRRSPAIIDIKANSRV